MFDSSNFGFLRIKDFSKVKSGGTPLREKGTLYFSKSGHNWIKTLDLNNAHIWDSEEKITDLALKESSCSIFPKNTVLVAMYGGFNQIGRTGLLKVDAAINQAISGIIVDQKIVSPEYLLHYLNHDRKQWKKYAASSRKDPNITREDVLGFRVYVPSLLIQAKIVEILSTWDKSIEATGRLLENSKKRKKALMQQLLTGKKRLPGFGPTKEFVTTKYGEMPSDWKFTKISDFASQKSIRANDEKVRRVLSCSKHEGFVDSLSYFKKQVFSEDTSNYKVVKRNWFGFPANHIEEGSIGLQNVCDEGIVSPIYIVFALDEKKCMPEYLYPILKTEHYRQIFAASTNASVDRRGSLRWDGFGIIKIALPSVKEQEAISAVISTAERQISALERKLTALKEEKKALMQQLLTGKKRVKVEDAA